MGGGGPGAPRRYRVFLSYSHADTNWARWLMRRLEGWRVPRRFHGRAAPIGTVGPRIAPVFRDRDELPTTSDLGETIRAALRESETLVVICSPTAAKSRWVKEEILAFKRLHGERRVFGFIVGGEPKAEGEEADCFSPALRAEIGADGELSGRRAEIVAADARAQGDGKELALVRLLAGLLGLGFDELRQREQVRRLRRMTWIAVGAAVLVAALVGTGVVTWRANVAERAAQEDARRRQQSGEELIAFMLDDLKTGLQKSEKLETLDRTGERIMSYFQSLNPRDLSDTTLTQQAKALTRIGQIRIAQARYPEAMRAVSTAYARSAALADRYPNNGDLLFERGQAEYWIGFVHRRLNNLSGAEEWFSRYRGTSLALVAIDSTKQTWMVELASGQHNLAVLHFDRGEFDAAYAEFKAKQTTLRGLLARDPKNLDFQFRMADSESWLGSVAERRGELGQAVAHFRAQAGSLAGIVRADPSTPKWKFAHAVSLSLLSNALALAGARAEASVRIAESCRLANELMALDPGNREWLRNALRFRLRQAELYRAEGEAESATLSAADLIASYGKISSSGALDRLTSDHFSAAWRLEAQLRLAAGRKDAADAISRALAMDETQLRAATVDNATLGACATNLVVAAQISGPGTTGARKYAERAFALVAQRLDGSRDWHLLDPAARALAVLGREEEGRKLVARLVNIGYHPLDPLPASILSAPTTK